jgi:hypothetical protein
MPNPLRPHRGRASVVALALLLAAVAAACSSSEGSDPTTTIASASGTAETGDDGPGTTERPGTTTTDPPRTGTSAVDPSEDPPTGDETEADYADALIASYEADDDEIFTLQDVECISPKWVAAIGVEAFQAAGVTPADIETGESGIQDVVIDRDAAEDIVDAIPECGLELMVLFVDGLPSRVKDDPAAVACIEGSVTVEQVREALIAEIMGAEGEDPEDLAASCIE